MSELHFTGNLSKQERNVVEDTSTVDTYGSIRMKMGNEGDGYYFHSYTSAGVFAFDPELKAAFTQAADGIETFKALVDKRITDLGGDPDEYDM